MFSAFDPAYECGYAAGAAFVLAACVMHLKGHPRTAIALLALGATVLRCVAAALDPFLNDWDEAYHAVVAKNLMEHPLTPMLYRETALPISSHWPEQHIWLHKPPFFLWQIALSLKLFGLHPWAVRLPSVFWTSLLVPVIWRMGTLLRNERTGFIAAALCACSYLLQELTAGMINTDHNDSVFIATVACSWLAWLEHVRNASLRWAVATGLVSACAVLTKWYVGGVVFLPWTIWLVLQRFSRTALRTYLMGAVALLLPVCAWLLHIITWFPAEARFEQVFKTLHFSVAMDGHSGSPWFHFEVIDTLLPPLTWWTVLPACLWLLWRCRGMAHRLLIGAPLLAVHLFFALAATKMICYTLVLLPIYMLAIGSAMDDLIALIKHQLVRQGAFIIAFVALCAYGMNMPKVEATHSLIGNGLADPRWRQQNLMAMHDFPKLARFLSSNEKPIVFNMCRNHHLRYMFAYGTEVWAKPPDAPAVDRLRQKGYSVFVIQDGADPTSFPSTTILVPDSVFSISKDVRM